MKKDNNSNKISVVKKSGSKRKKKNAIDSTRDLDKSISMIMVFLKFLIWFPLAFIGFLSVLEGLNYLIIYDNYTEEAKARYKELINCSSYDESNYCDIVYTYKVRTKEYEFIDKSINTENLEEEINIYYDVEYPKSSISEVDINSAKSSLFIGLLFMFMGIANIIGKGGKISFKK